MGVEDQVKDPFLHTLRHKARLTFCLSSPAEKPVQKSPAFRGATGHCLHQGPLTEGVHRVIGVELTVKTRSH
jgi:hypothetical protein